MLGAGTERDSPFRDNRGHLKKDPLVDGARRSPTRATDAGAVPRLDRPAPPPACRLTTRCPRSARSCCSGSRACLRCLCARHPAHGTVGTRIAALGDGRLRARHGAMARAASASRKGGRGDRQHERIDGCVSHACNRCATDQTNATGERYSAIAADDGAPPPRPGFSIITSGTIATKLTTMIQNACSRPSICACSAVCCAISASP